MQTAISLAAYKASEEGRDKEALIEVEKEDVKKVVNKKIVWSPPRCLMKTAGWQWDTAGLLLGLKLRKMHNIV